MISKNKAKCIGVGEVTLIKSISFYRCLTAAFFLQCSSDRAERKGWDSNIMAEAVVSIYETVLRRILFPTLKADEFYNNFAKYDV